MVSRTDGTVAASACSRGRGVSWNLSSGIRQAVKRISPSAQLDSARGCSSARFRSNWRARLGSTRLVSARLASSQDCSTLALLSSVSATRLGRLVQPGLP